MLGKRQDPFLNNRVIGKWCLIVLAYFLCARFSLLFIVQPEGISVLWPPSGLFLASLLLIPTREWKFIVPLVMVSDLGSSVADGYAVLPSIGMAFANGADSLVGAWVCRRVFGRDKFLNCVQGLLLFSAIIMFINTPLSAMLGSFVLVAGGGFDAFVGTFRVWWVSTLLGNLLVAPLLLSIAELNFAHVIERSRPMIIVELVALIVVTLLVTDLVFHQRQNVQAGSLLYLIFPLLIWAAVRFGTLGASSISLLVAALAIWHSVHGHGPIGLMAGMDDSNLVWLQIYICTYLLSALLLAAAIGERNAAQEQIPLIAEAIPSLLAYVDADGVYRYVNQHYAKWFGSRKEGIVGQTLNTVMVQPAYHAIRANLERALRGEHVHWEGRIVLEAVGEKHVSATYVPHIDTHNRVQGVIAIVNDLSADEIAAQTIRLQSQIVENMAEAVYLSRVSDGIIVYANKTFANMYGFTENEYVGQSINRLFVQQGASDWQRDTAQIATHLHQQGEWQGEYLGVRADHRQFWVRATVTSFSHVEFGEVWLTVLQDIDVKIKAIQNLRHSEATVRALLNAPTDQIVLIGNTGDILDFNDAALHALVKNSPQVMVGQSIYQCLADPLQSKMRDAIELAQQQKYQTSFQTEVSGEWLDVSVYPIFDERREVPRLAIFCRDISALKKQAHDVLLAERAHRDTLVREVHHRIKNNLQSVVGLLRRSEKKWPALRDIVQEAIGQVNTIAIVHGLQGSRAFAKLDVVELLKVIVEAAAELSTVHIVTDFYLHDDRHYCLVDRESVPMALVLNELITNAVKHSVTHVGVIPSVQVMVRGEADEFVIQVKNPCVTREAGLDLNRNVAVGSGLQLVRSLLPSRGAELTFIHGDGYVNAQLRLASSIVMRQLDNIERVS